MTVLRFHSVKANYHKNILEIDFIKGRQETSSQLPFSVFDDLKISARNKFKKIEIEEMTGRQSVVFTLEDGTGGDFALDFVLYYCDPEYAWSPINQIKRSIKAQMKTSKVSVRVLADSLNTSPSQIMRLLKENNISKQWQQLSKLAELVGLCLRINLDVKK
ncbi:MAG: hypothetical protein ABII18_07680 [bacterium]